MNNFFYGEQHSSQGGSLHTPDDRSQHSAGHRFAMTARASSRAAWLSNVEIGKALQLLALRRGRLQRYDGTLPNVANAIDVRQHH